MLRKGGRKTGKLVVASWLAYAQRRTKGLSTHHPPTLYMPLCHHPYSITRLGLHIETPHVQSFPPFFYLMFSCLPLVEVHSGVTRSDESPSNGRTAYLKVKLLYTVFPSPLRPCKLPLPRFDCSYAKTDLKMEPARLAVIAVN